jgi:hypothetical protein
MAFIFAFLCIAHSCAPRSKRASVNDLHVAFSEIWQEQSLGCWRDSRSSYVRRGYCLGTLPVALMLAIVASREL